MDADCWVSTVKNEINFCVYLGLQEPDKILYMLPPDKQDFLKTSHGIVKKKFIQVCQDVIEKRPVLNIPDAVLEDNVSLHKLDETTIEKIDNQRMEWKENFKSEKLALDMAVADVLVDILPKPVEYEKYVSLVNKMKKVYQGVEERKNK